MEMDKIRKEGPTIRSPGQPTVSLCCFRFANSLQQCTQFPLVRWDDYKTRKEFRASKNMYAWCCAVVSVTSVTLCLQETLLQKLIKLKGKHQPASAASAITCLLPKPLVEHNIQMLQVLEGQVIWCNQKAHVLGISHDNCQTPPPGKELHELRPIRMIKPLCRIKFLRHDTSMIPKGSPKGCAYEAIHFVLLVLVKNSTYANLTQHMCSTWSLRNLMQHNVFLTPQIDMTQMLHECQGRFWLLLTCY